MYGRVCLPEMGLDELRMLNADLEVAFSSVEEFMLVNDGVVEAITENVFNVFMQRRAINELLSRRGL
jgi:hypothetical protein